MEFFLLSFLAGMLTALAPCVLPVLPIVIGGSLTDRNPWRPFIITASLGVSIVLFTLLLKASTLLIDIPQNFWKWFSGLIILFFGFITLFPDVWEKISIKFGFSSGSQKLMQGANTKQGIVGMIFMGAALGPVFASCSPVYFIILSTVLPASFIAGFINLIIYGLGLAFIMFIIAFFGQRAVAKLKWAADPHGKFRKGLGILFLMVGLSILTGYDKKVEIWVLDQGFDTTGFEQKLIEKFDAKK